MYSVLLVDDEIWSLEGIRKLFDWEKQGFTVTAQVTDASEAYDLICSTKPDVVFTDIRMPEISGIELLTKTRKAGIQSEFVIVSGFAEFEYAQEALRRGAFDYQLKPIDPDEAGLLLQKLKEQLDQNLEQERSAGANMMKELTSGSGSPLEVLKTRGFTPKGEYWQVIMVSGKSPDDNGKLPSFITSVHHLAVAVGDARTLLILNGDRLEDEEELIPIMDSWARGISEYVGISSAADDIGNLRRLIKEADMAASHYFVSAQPGAVKFTAAGSAGLDKVVRKTERLMLAKNDEEINSIMESLPGLFREENYGIYHAACLWNQFAVMISQRQECGQAAAVNDFLDYEELASRFGSLSSLCAAIEGMIRNVCHPAEAADRHTSYNGNFMALLEHVNQNYAKELSLSELADKFFLNMSYCSELFKKATGYTFRYYVTKLRMETAAELIQSGKYSVDRISDMTGYHDYYYFCKIFKRFYGITPSKFNAK